MLIGVFNLVYKRGFMMILFVERMMIFEEQVNVINGK